MKIKRGLKILTIFIFAFLAFQINAKVNATTTNYDACKSKQSFSRIYKVKSKSGSDITNELVKYLEEAKSITSDIDYAMIYIPSGTYYLGYDNNLVLHSHIYLVAEDDTKIIKTSANSSIIRTRSSENSKYCTIYGGVWDGNNKASQGIEINKATNITVQKLKVQNCKNNGIYLNNKSTAKIDSCISTKNKNSGLAVYTSSTVNLKNSTISYNSEYGICVAGGSILNANNTANNNINNNNWSGISATGTSTKVYLHKNTITYNGKKPKATSEGAVGHGIGISEGAYANITNNVIKNNKECGISIFDNSKAKINKNTINNNGRHGIGARKKVNLTSISSNNISNNKYNGILLSDNSKAQMSKNIINENKNLGISVVDKSTATLTSNTISNNKNSNISISNGDKKKSGAKLTLKNDNDINKSKTHGIVLSGNNTLEITGKNNKISNNSKNGISISDKAKLIITGKTTINSNKNNGIYVKNSNAEVKNVTISKSGKYGACVENGGYLKIKKSNIKSNKNYGINVSGKGTVATILENEISSNKKVGIMINNKAKAKSIEKNKINKNGETGIMIKKSSKVEKIINNKITNHTKYGIAVYSSTAKNINNNTFKNPKAKKSIYRN